MPTALTSPKRAVQFTVGIPPFENIYVLQRTAKLVKFTYRPFF